MYFQLIIITSSQCGCVVSDEKSLENKFSESQKSLKSICDFIVHHIET